MEILELNIAGGDESRYGCYSLPVTAGFVIIPNNSVAQELISAGVRDSKEIKSEEERSKLAKMIKTKCNLLTGDRKLPLWGVGFATVEEIDVMNVYSAKFLAMRRAYFNLGVVPAAIAVDGNKPIPELEVQQFTYVGGDRTYLQIACASILAKDYGDRFCRLYSEGIPSYELTKNKGYGNAAEKAIANYGIIPGIHRRSFKSVKRYEKSQIEDVQQLSIL